VTATDYPALITEIKTRTWQGKKDPSQGGIAADVTLELQLPPDEQTKVGQPTIQLRDGFILDLTEGGNIDNGIVRNNRLRRYREALDMNKPGDSFSMRLMQGRRVTVKVKHVPVEQEIYERVAAITKAA
jgi:hypothetical protein